MYEFQNSGGSVEVSQECRSMLEKLWEEHRVPLPEEEGGHVSGILVKQLQDENEHVGLRLRSAQLLFDLHMRGHILLSDAVDSYLVERDDEVVRSLMTYGSFSDDGRMLLKMLKGQLNQTEKGELSGDIGDFTEACAVEDDPAEPHVCNQSLAYTTSKCLISAVVAGHLCVSVPQDFLLVYWNM